MAQLSHTRSTDVIVHLKSIFACHGIPKVLMSDNGPQFSGQPFTNFAASYGFRHITSSPRFPHRNGEAERAVQTVSTRSQSHSSPEWLQPGAAPHGPTSSHQGANFFFPAWACIAWHHRICSEGKGDGWHRTQALSCLPPEEQVWVTDARASPSFTYRDLGLLMALPDLVVIT